MWTQLKPLSGRLRITRAFLCVHVFCCAFWFLPPTTNAQDSYDPRVCFYQHGDYTGAEYCARESAQGMPSNLNGINWNDAVSSLKLFDGAKVILYENGAYDGYMGTYVSSTSGLSKNDIVSSFKVILPRERPRVCLYTQSNFRGTETCYTQSPGTLSGTMNNSTSSIRLHGEIFIEVADGPNKSGTTQFITHDVSHMDASGTDDVNWDDQPSLDNEISWVGMYKYWETPLVCLWEHSRYTGDRFCTTSDIADLGNGIDDKTSSVRVHGYTVANLYKDTDYAGDETQVMHDTYILDYLNDEVSSVRVSLRSTQDFACLYEHWVYRGTSVCAEAEGRGDQNNRWATEVMGLSSIFASGNVVVDFYPQENFGGESMRVYHTHDRTRDLHGHPTSHGHFSYTKDWEDDIESFRVLPNSEFGSGNTAADSNYIRETELLEFNERLSRSVPFSNIFQTHNSAIARNYGFGGSQYTEAFLGRNQHHSVAAQLDMGVRVIELDIYSHPPGSGGQTVIPGGIRVCHSIDCHRLNQRQPLERYLTEVRNWLLGADEDDTITILLENGLHQAGDNSYYTAARGIFNTTLPNLVYTAHDARDQGVTLEFDARGCYWLPRNLTRQHIRAAGRRVVLILFHKSDVNKNCGWAGSSTNRFDTMVFTVKPFSEFHWYDDCNNTSVSFKAPRADSETFYYERVNESDNEFDNTRYTLAEEDEYMRCGGTGMSHDHMNWDALTPKPLADWDNERQVGTFEPLLYGFLEYDDLPKPTTNQGCVLRRSKVGRSAALSPSHDDMFLEKRSCTSNLPYACQDEASGNWFITDSAGPWSDGATSCSEEVATANFAVPWSKYQMVTLENAAAKPVVDGTYVCTVDPETCPSLEAWVNLRARNGQWLPLANLAGTFPSKGTMSSQFVIPNPNATFDFDISNGTDNDVGVFTSISVTDRAENAFYELDLRGVYFIDSIALWTVAAGWLLDVNKGGFSVFVSELPIPEMSRDLAGDGWQSVPSYVTEYSFPLGAHSTGVTSMDVGRNGRYVRFQLHGTDYLAFEEIKVYGY